MPTDTSLAPEDPDLLPVNPNSPTPHADKLTEILNNEKLPPDDQERVRSALRNHEAWVRAMDSIRATADDKVRGLVETLNNYKRQIELELIWDSSADFLYRQRGQLKLDNSIIEEFLPRLVDPDIIPALRGHRYETGPRTSFAAAYFTATLPSVTEGTGLQIRTKAQDFTVGRTAFIQASFDSGFPSGETLTREVYLAFVAAECKTNLDKTMFQEAIATATDLKMAVSGARYYLLCEWLDMTPISTRATSIDEVIILRGKRLASNIRSAFARSSERQSQRAWYADFLTKNPIRVNSILRFVNHLRALLDPTVPQEDAVLNRGYF